MEYDISVLSSLKCKQELFGFPEDTNSNIRKVLICEFHKNCLKWSAKREIRSANHDSWIANLNPEQVQMFEKCDSSIRKKWMVASFSISVRFMAKIGFCLDTGKCFFVEVSF